MKLKKWNKLSQKLVKENNYWQYKLDKFKIEGGMIGDYHYVHTLGSTMIVPFLSSDKILLVNQFRYLNQKESLEFPCGSIEEGLTPYDNAIKELREETGKTATLSSIGKFSPYNGVADEMCFVYIATDLKDSPLPHDSTEEFELIELSVQDFENKIKRNVIWDGMTLAAWLLIKNHLSI